jgi:hypothetical protein
MFSLSLGNSSSKYLDYTTMRKSEAKRMRVRLIHRLHRLINRRNLWMTVLVLAILTWTGCAAFQPTDANGPTANAPRYPITQADAETRLAEAAQAWYQLSQHYGLPGKTEANLNPYTATLTDLSPEGGCAKRSD